MLKYKASILIFIMVFLMMSSCSILGEKVVSNVNSTNIDKKGIIGFCTKFFTSIKDDDSKTFKGLVNDDGLFSLTYFVDQRDTNVVIHVDKDIIRDDLVLVNDKVGISLATMFDEGDISKIKEMPIITSDYLNSISFNVDWKSNDVNVIENDLENIVKTCQQINLVNNKNIPQVFVLKDNIYAFVKSSGVLEPKPEFTGDWVIFEKIGNEYIIRAVMQFQ